MPVYSEKLEPMYSKPLLHLVTKQVNGEISHIEEIRKIRLLLLSLAEITLKQPNGWTSTCRKRRPSPKVSKKQALFPIDHVPWTKRHSGLRGYCGVRKAGVQLDHYTSDRGVRSTMTSIHKSRRPQMRSLRKWNKMRSLLKWNKMRSLLKWNTMRLWPAHKLNCMRLTLSRLWLQKTLQKPRKQLPSWPASHRLIGQPLLGCVSVVSGTTRLISRAWLLSVSIYHQEWCHLRVQIDYRSRCLARARG